MSNTNETEHTRTSWDKLAAGYDEFVTPSHIDLGAHALRRAGLRAGMRFLDVAAGSGALSIPAARLGALVLSTDISPDMLAQLEARARKESLTLETRVMDGHALELEDDSFDMAGSQFGVMLFPDMPRGISELARVTKPGGRVVLVAFGSPTKIEFFNCFVAAIQFCGPRLHGAANGSSAAALPVAESRAGAPGVHQSRTQRRSCGDDHRDNGIPDQPTTVGLAREQ